MSFVDSDDFMDTDAYRKDYKYIKNNGARYFRFWVAIYISETGEKQKRKFS